jgi:hypothetical protein
MFTEPEPEPETRTMGRYGEKERKGRAETEGDQINDSR